MQRASPIPSPIPTSASLRKPGFGGSGKGLERPGIAHFVESVAVGKRDFVERGRDKLGLKVKGRRVAGTEVHCYLKEKQAPYS